MKEKELLAIRRHIELEEYLEYNYPKGKLPKEVIEIFYNKFKNFDDLEYLVDAYQMPIDEIRKDIGYYDSYIILNKPDEVQFISKLMEKYNVQRSKIIKRIQEVRSIDIEKKAGFKVKKRKKHQK